MKSTTSKSDPVRRALRGLFQVGAVTLAIQGYNLFAPRPLNAEQTAWVTAFGTFLVAFVQNMLEEAGAVPTMLKGPAPAPDLTARKLEALATATGAHEQELDRLQNAIRDLRADARPHPDQPYIGASHTTANIGPPSFTEWDAPVVPPRG